MGEASGISSDKTPQRNPIVLFGGANIGSLFFEERHRVIARIDDLEFGVVALLAMFASHCAAFSEKWMGRVVPKMIPILGFNCHSLLAGSC